VPILAIISHHCQKAGYFVKKQRVPHSIFKASHHLDSSKKPPNHGFR